MTTQTPVELRRARPLLGTLVEITAQGSSEMDLMSAMSRGFAAAARVQRLMSFHDRHSNVGRLNRLAHRSPVRVHPWTWEVLQTAQQLARATHGAFDITVGSELVRMGYLPRVACARADPRARWCDIDLLSGHRVHFARPLYIDLGGIAKGFAVDQAVAALRTGGIVSGLVNAGGDLRAFGSLARRIHLRHPAEPHVLIPCADITNGALATSAGYFTQRAWRGRAVTPVIDGARRVATNASFSASVAAPTCMLADALTKLVLLQGPRADGLVRRLGGRALIVSANPRVTELRRAA